MADDPLPDQPQPGDPGYVAPITTPTTAPTAGGTTGVPSVDPTNTDTYSYNTSSSSSTASTNACGGGLFLDKRLFIFRTMDKTKWFWWIDSVASNNTSSTASPSNPDPTQFKLVDPLTKKSISTSKNMAGKDSVLFYTKSLDNSWGLPADGTGNMNDHVFWAFYLQDGIAQPIYGVHYYNMWYDRELQTLDLVFWANVDGTLITGASSAQTVLYDNLKAAFLPGGAQDPNAQRVVFSATAKLVPFIVNRSIGSSASNQSQNALIMSLWVFDKPTMIFCPGTAPGHQADAVTDEIQAQTFLEYTP